MVRIQSISPRPQLNNFSRATVPLSMLFNFAVPQFVVALLILPCLHFFHIAILFYPFAHPFMSPVQLARAVCRKGSTRAFPPHHPLIPVDYQLTGQPVLIGGTMGTCSYVLTGTEQGMQVWINHKQVSQKGVLE